LSWHAVANSLASSSLTSQVFAQPDAEHFTVEAKTSLTIGPSALVFGIVLCPAAKHFIGASGHLEKDRVVERI